MPPLGLCLPPSQLPAGCRPDFLELNVQVFFQPLAPAEVFESARTDLGRTGLPALAANCFLPSSLPCVGPRVDLGAIERYAQSTFRRARQCGLGIIVFGSGYARAIPEGFPRERAREQFVECLRRIAPLAAAERIRIAIEPLNYQECNFINSLAEGAEFVRLAEHPAVRLLADTYHMGRDGDPAEAIRAVLPLLIHVHLAEKAYRTPPGYAGDDFRPYLAELKRGGYAGGLSIECNWGDTPMEAPRALAEIRRQWAEA